MLAVSAASYGLALPYTQDDRTRQNNRQQGARGNVAQADTAKRTAVAMPEVIIEDDSIPTRCCIRAGSYSALCRSLRTTSTAAWPTCLCPETFRRR